MRFPHVIFFSVFLAACGATVFTSQTKQALVADVIVDNSDPEATVENGTWDTASSASDHNGTDSMYAATGGTIEAYRFTPTLPGSATYTVSAWNSCYSNRSTAVPHEVYAADDTLIATVNVDQSGTNCATWEILGDYTLSPGAYVIIKDPGQAGTFFGADAIRFEANDPSSGGNGGSTSSGSTQTGAGGSPSQSGAGGQDCSSSSTGSTSGGSGGAGSSGPVPVTQFLDLFTGSTLDSSWEQLNTSMFTTTVETGQLKIAVNSSCANYPYCAWFNNTQGPLIFKVVSGNFRVEALVRPRTLSNPSQVPSTGFQFGGLLARDPAGSNQNYVMTVLGYREYHLANETKSTVNNVSSVKGPALPDQSSADRILVMCRHGQTFELHQKQIGASTFTLSDTITQTMATDLQVGLIGYTYGATSDVVAIFDYVEVEPLASLSDCVD